MSNLSPELLEQLIIKWADDKGIFDKSNAQFQLGKTLEECGEILQALTVRDMYNPELHSDDIEEISNKYSGFSNNIKLEYGDALVTLILGMSMNNMSMQECLAAAYEKISKRTGEMRDGVFVKQEESHD